MSFTQLDPTLPVTVEGKGKGYAFAVIDYGQEHHLIWVVAIDGSGEIWCAPNPKVRLQANWTLGRAVERPGSANVEPLRPAATAKSL
ncbi:MAG: hypothetical protein ACXU8S_01475 [Phenylobacterium sp.]